MSIFYTIGNTNLQTVSLVAKVVMNEIINNNEIPKIDKVIIFNTLSSNKMLKEQTDIYRKIMGENIRIEEILINNNNGTVSPEYFANVFNNKEEKIVDLTNGKKTTAAPLYLSASLVGVDNIYYLSLKVSPKDLPEKPVSQKHYEYIRIPKMGDISNFAQISYFDLIYYIEEINKILNVDDSSFLVIIKNDIKKSIDTFFKGDSYRSAISDATTFVEVFINLLLDFIKVYEPARNFSVKNGIQFNKKDPLGMVNFFFNRYSLKRHNDKNLKPLITLPGLLSALRNYRNLSAHSGSISRKFEFDEARIVINMSLEALRRAKMSDLFWHKLKKYH